MSSNNYIKISNAKVHNLKGVSLKLPRNKLIVITGVSGSGKSSLAFDTLYAEGQRRYVESLSSYARQFLGRINKPEVDFIKGIPPAVAIQQKVNTRNPRSTVGTSTEIYDYLKLLFARIGKTYSPISGVEVTKDSVSDVVAFILKYEEATKILILAPIVVDENIVEKFTMRGYARIFCDGKVFNLNDSEITNVIEQNNQLYLVVDRVIVNNDDDNVSRIADSIQTAFFEGNGTSIVLSLDNIETLNEFSDKFEVDGMQFIEPSEHLFSFNNPLGACPVCDGYGQTIGIDPDLVIPDKSLSIYSGAVLCWRGVKMNEWKEQLISYADKYDFPIHKPYFELSSQQKDLLWNGNDEIWGIYRFFKMVEENAYKIQYRVMLSRYRGETICPKCHGTRLRPEANCVMVCDKKIADLVQMPIDKLQEFFNTIKLNKHDNDVAKRILIEISSRLTFLFNVGLGYLTLNRGSVTLSGGESQRINLATSLGSSLVGSLYVLDEPSIGLHPRDTDKLVMVLEQLRDIGNTVVVVEHDEEFMRHADQIIDIGPEAGIHGGEVVFQGALKQLLENPVTLTGKYLSGEYKIEVPKIRRSGRNFVSVKGAFLHNLKNIDVDFQLQALTVVTGVSGSGKSSLVNGVLYPALQAKYTGNYIHKGMFVELSGDYGIHSGVEFIDQNPIGKSSRSNPATYMKAYDEIRKLYANQKSSKLMNFKPSHFSFNVEGGRCEECQGEGFVTIEMQFMADVRLICDECDGKRFKEDVLDVKFQGKNIYDVLEMSINEAVEFFGDSSDSIAKKIAIKLQPLVEVGLGYVKMGQASSTLSGGESQRVKLASFLSKEGNHDSMLFIFDEPTTGLHFHDIKKLVKAFNALIEKGNSIIVIEHNPEVIKSADWIVDLGPEGGVDGGGLVFQGTPEDLVCCNNSYTGKYLKAKL